MNNIYLFVGPSGVGKTTLVEKLASTFNYKVLESYTDRSPRFVGEGGHRFISPSDFDQLQDTCAYTEYSGYRYAATVAQVEESDLYVIDIEGVKYFRQKYKGSKGIFVFGLVAETNILEKRMKSRGDSPEQIRQRLVHDAKAFYDIHHITDTLIRSSDLENTTAMLNEYIQYAEKRAKEELK